MEESFAKNLMRELKIDTTSLCREEWELKMLSMLYKSPLGKNLIFKGGTALRLAYNSPRFSEDLDFSLKGKIKNKTFNKIFNGLLKEIKKNYPEISISDTKDKFYTLFCLLKIKEAWLPRSFSIKIEMSKREKPEETEIKTLTSPTTNIQVVANVQTLNQILKDKIQAIKTRVKPRDFFDISYIYQLKRQPVKLPKKKISPLKLKSELGKFLPQEYRKVIDQILKEIKK
jgi:predicted nucleotidyltransferase component of viral defense system